MTRGLESALGLPHLDDMIEEQEKNNLPTKVEREGHDNLLADIKASEMFTGLMKGTDHGDAMDTVHDETLKHARDLVDLGFNIDHAKARGIFEQAGNFYKIAVDAKNSKRDMQLKAMKLMLDHKKFEFEKSQATGEPTNVGQTIDTEATIVTDRNDLIKQYLEKKKNGAA